MEEIKVAERIKRLRKAFFHSLKNALGDTQGFLHSEQGINVGKIDFDAIFNPLGSEDEVGSFWNECLRFRCGTADHEGRVAESLTTTVP